VLGGRVTLPDDPDAAAERLAERYGIAGARRWLLRVLHVLERYGRAS
jgi:hypothetical protein